MDVVAEPRASLAAVVFATGEVPASAWAEALVDKHVDEHRLLAFPSLHAALHVAADAARLGGRAGLGVGDVTLEMAADRPDVFGVPVIIAKRLLDLAAPGEALAPTDLVRSAVGAGGLVVEDLGPRALKGLGAEVPISRIVGASRLDPTLRLRAVLLTDWVSSSEAMSSAGATAADELRRAHFDLLQNALSGRGGQVLMNTGDGLLASFERLEDAAACASALHRSFQRSLTAASRTRIRAALALGDVPNPFTTRDSTGIWQELKEAEGLAGADETIATAAVGLLLARDPSYALQRHPAENGCWLLSPLARSRPEVPTALRITEVVVPRQRELAQLESSLEEVRAGRTSFIGIIGEAGIGKSTLLREYASRAHEAGAVVLHGRCEEEAVVPFQPFAEALRELVDAMQVDDLVHMVDPSAPELTSLIPSLGERLPFLRKPVETPDRLRLFDAVARLLRVLAEDHPVVLLVEDVHWSDAGSQQLFGHLVRGLRGSPLQFVVTMRHSDVTAPVARTLRELRNEVALSNIELGGLDEIEVHRLLDVQHGDARPTMALARELMELTSGNPFFIDEQIRHLRSQGLPLTSDSLRRAGVPSGAGWLIADRLADVDEPLLPLLRTAAVAGMDFDLDLLAELTDATVDEVAELLDLAIDLGLVVEVGDDFRFRHALTRQALYESSTATRRALLHGRVADALSGRADADLAAIALHSSRARGRDHLYRAVEAGLTSAALALEELAYEEAVKRFEMALSALERQGDQPRRRAETLVALAVASNLAGEPEAASRHAASAAEIARDGGFVDLACDSALWNEGEWETPGIVDEVTPRLVDQALAVVDPGDRSRTARLLASKAIHRANGWMRTESVPLSAEALAIARTQDDPAVLAAALNARQYALRAVPDATERALVVEEMLELGIGIGDLNLVTMARHWRVVELAAAGNLDDASDEIDRFGQVVQQTNRPMHRSLHDKLRAAQALWEGDLASAEVLIEQARASAAAVQRTGGTQQHAYQLVQLRMRQGRFVDAADIARTARERYPVVAAWTLHEACAVASQGDSQGATELAAVVWARPLPDNIFWLPSTLAGAELAITVGNRTTALHYLNELDPYRGVHFVIASGIAHRGAADVLLAELDRVASS